ncbi:XTP/dITP diphosphohydrolase [Sanguibacter antarcticus]|uniref:XTP/dITP diphosphohydrolase n=2 Tax=Sanguibacter antarcticus TaxID=372484 RepID=A0A2A9E2M5_9MICO|nr:XTP/dITP diphosphohydrolase [Sanguibacter antarcticus]
MSVNASRPFDDLVAVMDRLRSPGGCPWDAAQTHASLARHALEEAYELVETLETDDRAGMREELGDLLLQVVFNARVAHEHEREPFGIDDVVRDLTAKLVRRHPHVFADETYVDDASLTARWDAIKQEEKARTSCLDGVPLAQGALSRAQKVLSRAGRAGLAPTAALSLGVVVGDGAADVGAALLELVRHAAAVGVDAEGALREASRQVEAQVREAEEGQRAASAHGAGEARVK